MSDIQWCHFLSSLVLQLRGSTCCRCSVITCRTSWRIRTVWGRGWWNLWAEPTCLFRLTCTGNTRLLNLWRHGFGQNFVLRGHKEGIFEWTLVGTDWWGSCAVCWFRFVVDVMKMLLDFIETLEEKMMSVRCSDTTRDQLSQLVSHMTSPSSARVTD